MEFYEPTFLFRQNAIRRPETGSPYSSRHNSPHSLAESLPRYRCSLWLLNNNPKDMEITNKACALDRVNIKSNYWKIPDVNMNLTALAASNQFADTPLLAISSASAHSNLYIYELDALNNYLTHHTTISLPNIHGLAWVPNTNLRFLVSGNNKGYAHLVSVPLPKSYGGDDTQELAEIVKRFNHRKHLRLVSKDPSIHTHGNTVVLKVGFVNEEKLVSVYDDTLFVWDVNQCESSMKPRPDSISVVPGISNFDTRTNDVAMLALCGTFGISLFDTRTRSHNVPNALVARNISRKKMAANIVKWHPTNEQIIATAHGDGVVKLWDIRKEEPFSELTGHKNKTISSLQWNHNDIFTGASDGNIVHWDLSTDLPTDLADCANSIKKCSLKEGLKSVSFDTIQNLLVDTLSERQCGTRLPALNNLIVGMCQVNGSDGEKNARDCKVISIDGSAFLGLHSKIYDAVNVDQASEKLYYSSEDLSLMSKQENSNATLVASTENLTKPLAIKKHDMSTDTIDDVEDLNIHESYRIEDKLERNIPEESELYRIEESYRIDADVGSEFDFTIADFDLGSRLPESVFSPQTEMSDNYNDSTYTLLTTATIHEEAEHKHTKSILFLFLDSELLDICAEFQNQNTLAAQY